ncbi:MAG TPA: hypothetical protein VGW80_03465 [Solirubrobacterales bacterium]|jgi:hypothetical protein|nr:hypothetical protein [Solirubrobacterales bacterium]
MRRAPIFILVALLALSAGAVAWAAVEKSGNVLVHFNAEFSPHSLPRQDPAPIEVTIKGGITTTDGSHPPPMQWLEIELNRNGRLYTKGLPSCSPALLQSTSSKEAKARCGRAQVGHGSFSADIALGSNKPVTSTGRILAFNGRRSGKPALLLHFFGGVPVRFTLVVPLRIGHRKDGQFGTVLRARIPKLANGFGSITQIDLTLGRRWSFAGERRSYLSAACNAPRGFSGGPFTFARASFRFEDRPEISSTLTKACRVR